MKKRYLYVLLFGVPALLASAVITAVLFGAAAGLLWLFVLGDDPWPAIADHLIGALIALVGASLWIGLLSAAYLAGKRQEAHAGLNLRHVLASAGTTALLVLLVVSHQWRVGNIGPKSDGVVCSEFCQDKGYAGSGMPPRDSGAATCNCYDAQGGEVVKTTMADLGAARDR